MIESHENSGSWSRTNQPVLKSVLHHYGCIDCNPVRLSNSPSGLYFKLIWLATTNHLLQILRKCPKFSASIKVNYVNSSLNVHVNSKLISICWNYLNALIALIHTKWTLICLTLLWRKCDEPCQIENDTWQLQSMLECHLVEISIWLILTRMG